jgi:hypothetical protein
MQSRKIKKGGNSNLLDCNAIVQNKKKGGNCNLIDCSAIVQNNLFKALSLAGLGITVLRPSGYLFLIRHCSFGF